MARTIMQELSLTIQEEFPSAFEEIRSITDGVFDQVIKTSEGVDRAKVGLDWEVTHSFRSGLSGQFVSQDINRSIWRDDVTGMNPRFVNTSGMTAWPVAENTPHTNRFKITTKINHHKGVFSLPMEQLKVEALTASTYKTLGDEVEGVAKNLAHVEAVSFYMGSDGRLGKFTTPSSITSNTTNTQTYLDNNTYFYGSNPASGSPNTDWITITIKPTESRIGWFQEGMLVDIYQGTAYDDGDTVTAPTSTTAYGDTLPVKCADHVVVDKVDPILGLVTLSLYRGYSDVYKDAATGGAGTEWDSCIEASTSYYIYCADSALYRIGYNGLDNWIKASGYLFDMPYGTGNSAANTGIRAARVQQTGATSQSLLSLADYPMFKSVVKDAGGQPLTDALLTNVLGTMAEANPDWYPDVAITTRGVMHRFSELPNTGNFMQTVDRTNRAASFSSGIESWPTYQYEGRSIKFLISRFCRNGYLYALPLAGNLMRYVPPAMSGQGVLKNPATGLALSSEIEFVAPLLTGTDSIWMPSYTSGAVLLPQTYAPFLHWGQLIPKDVRGIKITNLAESDFSV